MSLHSVSFIAKYYGVSPSTIPKLSRATVYGASDFSEALVYGEASAEGGNPVTMSISF